MDFTDVPNESSENSSSEEKEALNQYMDEGGWLTEFKRTIEFEQRIADYTKAKHSEPALTN